MPRYKVALHSICPEVCNIILLSFSSAQFPLVFIEGTSIKQFCPRSSFQCSLTDLLRNLEAPQTGSRCNLKIRLLFTESVQCSMCEGFLSLHQKNNKCSSQHQHFLQFVFHVSYSGSALLKFNSEYVLSISSAPSFSAFPLTKAKRWSGFSKGDPDVIKLKCRWNHAY